MKFIFVCTKCGSPRVYADAFVSLNNPEDIRQYDDVHCMDCERESSVVEIVVPDTFDLGSDFYQEPT